MRCCQRSMRNRKVTKSIEVTLFVLLFVLAVGCFVLAAKANDALSGVHLNIEGHPVAIFESMEWCQRAAKWYRKAERSETLPLCGRLL